MKFCQEYVLTLRI
uniref:Uncharacterized protein n=1 Tax=Rhizophora mucronata TaxID=61149 RepID=A0A2P2QJE5_RHIMU